MDGAVGGVPSLPFQAAEGREGPWRRSVQPLYLLLLYVCMCERTYVCMHVCMYVGAGAYVCVFARIGLDLLRLLCCCYILSPLRCPWEHTGSAEMRLLEQYDILKIYILGQFNITLPHAKHPHGTVKTYNMAFSKHTFTSLRTIQLTKGMLRKGNANETLATLSAE